MRLNSSFLSVKLPCYHPQLSDTYTHNGYRTTPQGLKPSIKFCYRPRGTCLVWCSPVSIYYHKHIRKSTTFLIFRHGKMHKEYRGGVLVFVHFAQMKTAAPGNKYPRNKFFKVNSKFDFSFGICYNIHIGDPNAYLSRICPITLYFYGEMPNGESPTLRFFNQFDF